MHGNGSAINKLLLGYRERERKKKGIRTSRKARECNRDRKRPVLAELGRLQLSALPPPSPSLSSPPSLSLSRSKYERLAVFKWGYYSIFPNGHNDTFKLASAF